jgi:hypothetical protein
VIRSVALCSLLVLTVAPGLAWAQNDLSRVDRYRGALAYLTPRAGDEVLVRVVSAQIDTLVAQVGGVERSFSRAEIAKVSVQGRDSLKNGLLIGAGAGALMGSLSCQGGSSTCSVAGATVAGAAVFAALGAWLDHRREGRVVIYRGR